MQKHIWITLIASGVLVLGVPGRAVAQINGSQAADYEEFKRAILAARYAHDPRLIPLLQRKPISLADVGSQLSGRQAESDANAAANAGNFVAFDAPGAGTSSFQGTLAFAINPAGTITGYYVDANNVYHGFLRAGDGTVTTIDPPGTVFTQAWSINPAGTIMGKSAIQ